MQLTVDFRMFGATPYPVNQSMHGMSTKKVKAKCHGSIIPQNPHGVNRRTLGNRKSNMKCEQCGFHLCIKKDNSVGLIGTPKCESFASIVVQTVNCSM